MVAIADDALGDAPATTVVLDATVLAAALMRPGGTAERRWRAAVTGGQRPVTVASSIVELAGLLAGRFAWHPTLVDRAVRHVLRHVTVVAPDELLDAAAREGQRSQADAAADLMEARVHADHVRQIDALERLRRASIADPDRWRELSAELARVALDAGRREPAIRVAHDVISSFDDVPDRALTEGPRRALVSAVLVATTGQEYLSHAESDRAIELLLRTLGRLDAGDDAARLLFRAAEIVGMRPDAGAFARPWVDATRAEDGPDVPDGPGGRDGPGEEETARVVEGLLDRAASVLAGVEPPVPGLAALLDVAWARAHLQHEHADERRLRLARSLRELRGFDRAWAGTRLALDAMAVGDRALLQQALVDASPTSVGRSPLVAWRLETMRAMLLLATGGEGVADAVEAVAALGEQAGEPMGAIVAAVQRGVARVETDLTPLTDAEVRLDGPEVHPLIRIGRLEIVARDRAMRRRLTGEVQPVDATHAAQARELLAIVRAGSMNPGNRQLSAVLLARALFHLRDVLRRDVLRDGADGALVAYTAALVEPLGDLVPTDALGLVCAGSAARHLANLQALQGRHGDAERSAASAARRDATLGFERFLIAGRIDAAERRTLVGGRLGVEGRQALMEDAVSAERRGLALLGREARIAAHPVVHGALDEVHLELLEDLGRGLRFPELAEQRGYTVGTMRKMALPVYRALGVSGRYEAVALGRVTGLLPQPAAAPSAAPVG